ncbi:hypothetical protein [Martelella sp. HB161492]|uniref:hypothetical protein n=1 Tax=Martelella sp. HB161492 TaxID=2720726 RepID=UPI001591C769|nr:hypothetical protein [Martelella sp. HB161492]
MCRDDNHFYIVDMRPDFLGGRYLTFWRPNNSNYAYPLSWAGKYTAGQIEDGLLYYTVSNGRSLIRFAVPCHIADALAEPPEPGTIDGDASPVVSNTRRNRRKLREAAFIPVGWRKHG